MKELDLKMVIPIAHKKLGVRCTSVSASTDLNFAGKWLGSGSLEFKKGLCQRTVDRKSLVL